MTRNKSQIANTTNSKSPIIILLASLLSSSVLCGYAQTRATQSNRSRGVKASSLPDGVSAKDVRFYSEGIQCYGRIFTPKGFAAGKLAPAVVLAPGWGEIASSIEKYGAQFASRGIVAMIIDYRGWGRSGGFLQSVDAVKTDDRLRFSQMTARVRIRRKRLIPQHQILDIRNALYYLQGEPGVDRARVGVWGTGVAGGHVIVIAATDSRIKAAVANAPVIEGKNVPRKASAPTGALLQAEQQRARTGQISSGAANGPAADVETRLSLVDYHPFWQVEQIPKTAAVLFVIADKDPGGKNDSAIAASKLLKGATSIVRVPGVTDSRINSGAGFDVAAKAAAEWFLKHL
jgi:dienelactone hydrolase